MDWLKNGDYKSLSVPKIIGLIFLAIVALIIVVWLLGFGIRTALFGTRVSYPQAYDSYNAAPSDYKLSTRNIASEGGSTVSNDSEKFEITEHNATYETGNLEKVCGSIEVLKPLNYVVFENANRGDKSCSYTFKVKNANVPEIREVLDKLGPKTFVTNTRTIKSQLDDFTSEEQILKKKLEAIETTLLDASRAYDELKVLATRSQNADSLAKVIDSKVHLIERLTTERLNTNIALDRIAKQKAESLDRLDYVYFGVYVYENKIIYWTHIKDSWIQSARNFVSELNQIMQGITLGLGTFLLRVVQAAVYIVLAVLIAKYGWRAGKKLWKY